MMPPAAPSLEILCFADTRFPIERANGWQTMATCHALAARGHDVTLITRPDTATPTRDPFAFYGLAPEPRLHLDVIDGPRLPNARRARFLLGAARRARARTGPVVFTRDLGLAAFLLRFPGARRPPVVYESHGLSAVVSAEMPSLLGKPELAPSPRKLRRLDRRERLVWRRADAYVTITRALGDELVSRFGPRERGMFVVPDGATLPDASLPESTAPNGRPPVAGYAGHLYPWKGVDVFIRALAMTPGIRGLIVGGHPGEPDRARIEALISDLGIANRVDLVGLVPPPLVRSHLERATLLVLPNTRSAISLRYTSPLKLFEYLTMGLPIVASDLPAIREVLTDRETALLVPPGDAAALSAAMSTLASDVPLCRALARAAQALAPSYSWDRRAARLEPALAEARAR